jgi:hypothetical protein
VGRLARSDGDEDQRVVPSTCTVACQVGLGPAKVLVGDLSRFQAGWAA